MKKLCLSSLVLLSLFILTSCTSQQKNIVKEQQKSLTKQEVLDKTLEKMKTAKGFSFNFVQNYQLTMTKPGQVLNRTQTTKLNAEYLSDKEYHGVMSITDSGLYDGEDGQIEAYAKDNKTYTKNNRTKRWIAYSNATPVDALGAEFEFFKSVDQLQKMKDNPSYVKFSEEETSYQLDLLVQNSDDLTKFVDKQPDPTIVPKSLQYTIKVDKKDFHVISLEKKDVGLQTKPDQKVDIKITTTFKWSGPVTSITLPAEVKNAPSQ